jgi:hypothetical protein
VQVPSVSVAMKSVSQLATKEPDMSERRRTPERNVTGGGLVVSVTVTAHCAAPDPNYAGIPDRDSTLAGCLNASPGW